MTLFAMAALAAALAVAPSEAGAAPARTAPAPAAARPAAGPATTLQADGVGGPIEPVELDVSAILVEGRKADDGSWRAAVDPALERRSGPREPARYNPITIPF